MKKLYRLIPLVAYIVAIFCYIQALRNPDNSFEPFVRGTLDLIIGLLLQLHYKIEDYGHFTLRMNENLSEMLKVFLGASEEESEEEPKDDVKEDK